MTSKLLQTAMLLIAAPFLWFFHGVCFTLLVLGQTVAAIGRVWR